MNYIKQINGFWEKCEEHELSATEIALYFALLKLSNDFAWSNPIKINAGMIYAVTGISKNTFYKVLTSLSEKGFITWTKGLKRVQKASVFIHSFDLDFNPNSENKQGTKRENKPKNKRETKAGNLTKQETINFKTLNNKDKEIEESFLIFWDLYAKKVAPQICRNLWAKLSQKNRKLILEYVPGYVEATPDKQYRKNPATFIRQKSWLDELPVASNQAQELDENQKKIKERLKSKNYKI